MEGFKLYYRNNQNQSQKFYLLGEFDKNTNEYLHDSLINDLQYFYKMQTFDSVPNYSPFTKILTATPSDILPPTKPTGLKIEVVESGGALKISWNPNNDADLEGYRIYRSDGKDYSLIMAVDVDTISAIDTGLENIIPGEDTMIAPEIEPQSEDQWVLEQENSDHTPGDDGSE